MSEQQARPFLSVVIPAYNEECRLVPTLSRIQQYLAAQSYSSEVIVVDNASADGTAEVARLGGARVLSEPQRGKGAAVRTGMLAAEGEYVLFSDADLSTPIEEVEKLLAALRSGSDIADRVAGAAGIEHHRASALASGAGGQDRQSAGEDVGGARHRRHAVRVQAVSA